jgi:hypothetical protein
VSRTAHHTDIETVNDSNESWQFEYLQRPTFFWPSDSFLERAAKGIGSIQQGAQTYRPQSRSLFGAESLQPWTNLPQKTLLTLEKGPYTKATD